ncbi:hypothetical protein RGUI_0032 (plasmid) [Rhodovulum sp. P5]|nr:hypothetical protein RGUI_0032 [Rhodovulum sp. P5]
MHPALDGLLGRHSEAGELAKRVVLRCDHTRIRAVCLGLCGDGHGAFLCEVETPNPKPTFPFLFYGAPD